MEQFAINGLSRFGRRRLEEPPNGGSEVIIIDTNRWGLFRRSFSRKP